MYCRARRLTGEDVGKSVFVLVPRILGSVVYCRGFSTECLHGNNRGRLEERGRRGGTHQVFLLKSFVSVLVHLSDMSLKLIQTDGLRPCSFCEGVRGS